jgi:hypothetical protein
MLAGAQRILDAVMVVCFIVLMGCATGKSSPKPIEPRKEVITETPRETDRASVKTKPFSASVECKKMVKSLNTPLIVAIMTATRGASGTPVRATEIKKSGHTSYRVLLQGASGEPTPVDIDQRTVDGEKLVEPSSTAECKSLERARASGKEDPIVTAIRLAEGHLNGRAEDVGFERREEDYVYAVTVEDSKGLHHTVLVDANGAKIIKEEMVK